MRKFAGALLVGALFLSGLSACTSGGTAGGAPCDVKVSTDTKSKPDITVPKCDKPTALQVKDIVEGRGEPAKAGDAVTVQYTGVSWSTREQFDSSWAPGRTPYTVQPLGQAAVIQGWNQGLVGVKTGGRRLLVIPAALGYGQQGRKNAIAPGETLVFVVDVVSINGK
jgi:peptidylprolyl isomerase